MVFYIIRPIALDRQCNQLEHFVKYCLNSRLFLFTSG